MATPAASVLDADLAWPLHDDEPIDGAFKLAKPDGTLARAVVTGVSRPWLFGYRPAPGRADHGRAVLILGGGGYVELMVGREGVAVARWLAALGFHAFVLVHRFPGAGRAGPGAPLEDARRALALIAAQGFGARGLGVCGLSSGGHLGAALLAGCAPLPAWGARPATEKVPDLAFAVIGYAPVSTNAAGRTVVADKPPLPPPEKQALYDGVQPDAQVSTTYGASGGGGGSAAPPPPTFVVYAGNDPVVPVANAYRLAQALTAARGAVELHVFADAPHGFALDTEGLPVASWPRLCEAWLEQGGFLAP